MVKCVVAGCESRTNTNLRIPGVTFHRFPRDEKRKSIWLYNLGLLYVSARSRSLVCSLHFENSCYRTSTKVRRLLSDAYPTKLLGSFVNNMESEDTTSAPEDHNANQFTSENMPVVPTPLNNTFVQQPAVGDTVNTQEKDSPSSKSTESDSSSSGDSTCADDCPHHEHNPKSALEVAKQGSLPEENGTIASTGNAVHYQMEHFKRSLYIQKLKNRLNRAKLRNLKKCEKIRHLKYKLEKYKSKCQNVEPTSTSTQQPNGFSYCVSGYYGASGYGN